MPPPRSKPGLPDGFKSFADYNAARKDKRKLKQDYLIAKVEKQKAKEAAAAAVVAADKKIKKCEEPSTLSIAVPGSILDNAASFELRTYLAGQIARAACVFKVDEIIVYDDVGIQDSATAKTEVCISDSGEARPSRKCCAQLARILQFLECPQYLRKDFFPHHRDLDYAGLLNPLDAPHHMRQQDNTRFREGVVINQPAKSGCFANVGLLQHAKLDLPLQPGIRVTVEMLPSPPEAKRLRGRVVAPNVPHKETGVYWGYSVRIANTLNAVFTECPYKEGYDVSIGTSERGEVVENVSLPKHHHVLVVFGGLAGLEGALEADDVLTVDDPALLFDHYVNTCPDQGSRTIRTEEAILITLAQLRTKFKPKIFFTAPPKVSESDQEEGDDDDEEEAGSASGSDEDVKHFSIEGTEGSEIEKNISEVEPENGQVDSKAPTLKKERKKKKKVNVNEEDSGIDSKKSKTDTINEELNTNQSCLESGSGTKVLATAKVKRKKQKSRGGKT